MSAMTSKLVSDEILKALSIAGSFLEDNPSLPRDVMRSLRSCSRSSQEYINFLDKNASGNEIIVEEALNKLKSSWALFKAQASQGKMLPLAVSDADLHMQAAFGRSISPGHDTKSRVKYFEAKYAAIIDELAALPSQTELAISKIPPPPEFVHNENLGKDIERLKQEIADKKEILTEKKNIYDKARARLRRAKEALKEIPEIEQVPPLEPLQAELERLSQPLGEFEEEEQEHIEEEEEDNAEDDGYMLEWLQKEVKLLAKMGTGYVPRAPEHIDRM